MRKTIIALLMPFALTISAQDSGMAVNTGFDGSLTKFATQNAMDFGSSVSFRNPGKIVEGSTHLFDKWENRGVIVDNSGKRYSVSNINLNLRTQSFESLYEGDKIFIFNFNNIDKFIVNNKSYINYYYNDDINVYEVIAKIKDVEFLKGFRLKFVEGSANPMLNRSADKYIRKENFYVKIGDEIQPFKLKKKRVLKLLGKDNEESVLKYAKDNELSFKKEQDVKQIIEQFI